MGLDFKPVVIALTAWGDRWAAPHGPPLCSNTRAAEGASNNSVVERAAAAFRNSRTLSRAVDDCVSSDAKFSGIQVLICEHHYDDRD
jgi:hypothetical protein